MKLSFDLAKNARNIQERGLDFNLVSEFDWTDAVIDEDIRQDYGERRFRVLGCIGKRLHSFVPLYLRRVRIDSTSSACAKQT